MAEVVEFLRAARAKIEKPECWTKGYYARNARGVPAAVKSGVCFCALGAVYSLPVESFRAVYALEKALPGEFVDIVDFNDNPATTHADILALFDRAIAKATAP